MFLSVERLRDIPIRGTDETIGHLEQVYFDDLKWVIRYLVVRTDALRMHRRILVSPIAADRLDLSRGAIRSAPRFESLAGITPEYAERLRAHYGFPSGTHSGSEQPPA